MGATLEEVTNKELKDLIDSIASAVVGITGRLPGMQTCVSLVGEEKKFRFAIPVIDNINGPIAAADITAGTYDLIRIRNGTETTIVNDGAFSKANGLIYVDITFDAGDTWNDNDAYMLIPNMDSKAKIGTTTYFLQIAPWSGMVFNIAGIDAEVAAIEAKLDNGTYGLAALNTDLDIVLAALANATYGLPALNIDLDTIIALLGTPAGASLAADIIAIEAKLDNGTWGLSALNDDLDTLLARLTLARAGYLDELAAANIPADIDTLLARLTATRAGYLDELDFDLDARLGSPAGASLAADLLTIDNLVDDLETRLTTQRALNLDLLGLTSFKQETAGATAVNGTTWGDLLDKSTITKPTKICGFMVTIAGTWAGNAKIRIVDGSGNKIFPFKDEYIQGTDFFSATQVDFTFAVVVPIADGYKVQFRSSNAADGAGDTLQLNNLDVIETG